MKNPIKIPPAQPQKPIVPSFGQLEGGNLPQKKENEGFTLEEILAAIPPHVDPKTITFHPRDGGCCYGGDAFEICWPDDERNPQFQKELRSWEEHMKWWEEAMKEFEAEQKEELQRELEEAEKKVELLKGRLKK